MVRTVRTCVRSMNLSDPFKQFCFSFFFFVMLTLQLVEPFAESPLHLCPRDFCFLLSFFLLSMQLQ